MKGPQTFSSLEELSERIGSEIGRSSWYSLSQSMVNLFAALTRDENPIHIDPISAEGSTFGGTIVHGFYTLSLLADMAYEVVPGLPGVTVNYGFDRVRFVAPVPVGSRVRGIFTLSALDMATEGRWKATYQVSVEIDGLDSPALVALWIMAGVGGR